MPRSREQQREFTRILEEEQAELDRIEGRPTPDRPSTGCRIDGSETLADWALRLAGERLAAIVDPTELAHAQHRRDELRAALTEARASTALDVDAAIDAN